MFEIFQKMGIFYNYIASRGNIQNADFGRMNVTGKQLIFNSKTPVDVEIDVTVSDGNLKIQYR